MSSNQQILKLAIKDSSENNFEQELREFPSAIVTRTNDMNNFSEQFNYMSPEVEDHIFSWPYAFAEVYLKSNAHEQVGYIYSRVQKMRDLN